MTEPADTAPPPSPAAPRRGARWLAWSAALLLLVVAALIGTAGWLLRTESGTLRLLPWLPGVQASGWRGALLGEAFSAERLVVQVPAGPTLTIEGLRADGLRWQWRPDESAWLGLSIDNLQARRVAVASGPPSGQPLAEPENLSLPLRLAVNALRVAELQIDAQPPLRDIDAAFTLGADAHRLERLSLTRDGVQLQASGEVATTAPLATDAELRAAPAGEGPPAWAAVLRATGPLARLDVQGSLRGRPREGRAAPSADLRAGITPFVPWPLASLSAQTQALDLAALASAAPETRLSGRIDVDSRAADAPIGLRIVLDNALAGRWDEGRLPVSRIALALQGQARQRDVVTVDTFDLLLAGARPAGRLQGSGEWRGDTLRLDARLADVQPGQLDGRAAAMQLSGTLGVQLEGLPQPSGAAASRPWAADVRAQLDGLLSGAPQAVQLTLDARAQADRIDVRAFRASAGAAKAELSGSARRSAGGPWQLASQGQLTEFDPLPWWPGTTGSAWRQGPHKLSAAWQFDLRMPADAGTLDPLTLAQRLVGSGTLSLRDSVLAGVPLTMDLALDRRAGAAGTLRGQVEAGGNLLTLDGQADTTGPSDRLALALRANTLATLAPLFKLHPALAAWAPRQGSAQATLALRGRWPAIATEGQATLTALQLGELALDRAQGRWQLALQGEQPLELQAEASGLRLRGQRAERLVADVRGNAARHRIELSATLPVLPPAWAGPVLGLRPGAGTRATLQGEGGWQRDAAGGGRWSARVARLSAGSWDGKPASGPAPGDWFDSRDLRADLRFDATGALATLEATPGRARLAGAFDMRWDAVRVDLRGAQPNIDLQAEIEAFRVAPLLARLQPGMGWTGDLQLGARIDIQAAEKFDAEIVVERRQGDLQVAEDIGSRALGLTDLRASLSAHDGQWTIAQALAGRALGEMAGAVNVRTTPAARWPAADAPMEGVLQARVANLGVWGVWVPAGWRLAGELTTSATIGGSFGAPEYTGEVRGTGLGVRNLLQGVNVTQGQVLVLLKGATAQIERFDFRAGEGSLSLTGGASFGAEPTARLKLVAQRFRALGRIDRQLTASGTAELTLAAEQIKLDGKLTVDEALIDAGRGNAPQLDDDVSVRNAAIEAAEQAAPAARPRQAALVDLEIDLGDKFRLRGYGVDTGLKGRLRITAPGGRLAVRGTVNTVGGNYAAYGQKLQVERGIVAFSGPVGDPRLDILALRPNIDMRVGVAISGTAQVPRVRLYSDPDMSDTDKLSWLMLGRAPDGLGSADTALLQRAALALLSGEGEAPTDALLRTIGIDEISLRQQSDGDARETVVTIGKQLSRRWYVGYERGVNATSGTWQLIYRIAQRFTLRAQSGNENSLDLIWVWRPGDPIIGRMPRPVGTAP